MEEIAFDAIQAYPDEVQEDSNKKKLPKFLNILYSVLESPEHEREIHWIENGRQFKVVDRAEFAQLVLGTHFKHSNYTTFIRQLNIYGFKKGKDVDGCDIFGHPLFLRDQKHLLALMSRNQKKKRDYAKAVVNVVKPLKKFKPGDEFRDLNLCRLLNMEIRRLEELQDQLSTKVAFVNLRNETKDLEMQMLINRYSKEEQNRQAGYIVVLILSKYIQSKDNKVVILPQKDIDTINLLAKSWLGNAQPIPYKYPHYPPMYCYLLSRFLIAFQLRCMLLTEEGKRYLEQISQKFLVWLDKFVKKNKIEFPLIDALFMKLIFCIMGKGIAKNLLKQNIDESSGKLMQVSDHPVAVKMRELMDIMFINSQIQSEYEVFSHKESNSTDSEGGSQGINFSCVRFSEPSKEEEMKCSPEEANECKKEKIAGESKNHEESENLDSASFGEPEAASEDQESSSEGKLIMPNSQNLFESSLKV